MTSDYLERIITRQNRTAQLKVVFVDVRSYSKRRSQAQVSVVDAFMGCLAGALKDTSKEYIDYAQANDINYQSDIIALPSGDGAAIVFPFDGIHDIHLFFSVQLLREVKENNERSNCDKFQDHGWCNCHDSFNLSIGVSEGKGILYKDINDSYNVAGNVINMAARVMGVAEANQIFFTDESYRTLIDMVDNPNLDERFSEYVGVKIKHGIRVNVYQYIGDEGVVNTSPAEDLVFEQKARNLIKSFGNFGFPFDVERPEDIDKKKMIGMLEMLSQILTPKEPVIDVTPEVKENSKGPNNPVERDREKPGPV